MGGCASKPKGMDLHPTEVPATPTNKHETGNNNGGESSAAPLVDLSESNEPKQEAGGDPDPTSAVAPSKPAEPKPEPEPEPAGVPDRKSTTADLTQAEKVETIAKESEDKTTEATVHTQSTEGHPKTHVVADTTKSDATSTASEDKSVAPVVAV